MNDLPSAQAALPSARPVTIEVAPGELIDKITILQIKVGIGFKIPWGIRVIGAKIISLIPVGRVMASLFAMSPIRRWQFHAWLRYR